MTQQSVQPSHPTFRAPIKDSAASARIAEIEDAGIVLDQFGLLVPQKSIRALERVVAPSFQEGQSRIQRVIAEGKTVLYFPGAFDLPHVGHASYILQGINTFLKCVPGMRREDLFVVVAVDSDLLIATTKAPGAGEHPRPIQSANNFNMLLAADTDRNPRALDMAGLPVDLVMITPSPAEMSELVNNWHFKRWLSSGASFMRDAKAVKALGSQSVQQEARAAIGDFERLITAMQKPEGLRLVQEGFTRALHHLESREEAVWSLPSWQLMMNRFIGSVAASERGGCYRVLSERDSYSGIVKNLMDISGIHTVLVNDDYVLSTTDLIKTNGWDKLLSAKWESFERLMGGAR